MHQEIITNSCLHRLVGIQASKSSAITQTTLDLVFNIIISIIITFWNLETTMEIPLVQHPTIHLQTKALLRILTKLTTTRVINNNRIKPQALPLLSSITDIRINIHLVQESRSFLGNVFWRAWIQDLQLINHRLNFMLLPVEKAV